MSVTTKPKTAEDLYLMGEDARFELIEGALRPESPMTKHHARIVTKLALSLGTFVMVHGLGIVYTGDTGFILERGPDTVLGPDLAFVRAGGPPEEDEGFSPNMPDLVIEVISPSDRPGKINDRVRRYLAAGVPIVALGIPRTRTIEVHDAAGSRTLREGDKLADLSVLPGFRLPVADIFG